MDNRPENQAGTAFILKDRLGDLVRHPLAQSLAMFGSSAGLAQGMMVIYAILLARRLAPENYGIFVACYAVATLSAFLFNWGLDSWLLKEASASEEPLVLTGNVLRIKAILGIGWGAGLLFLFPAIRPEIYPPLLLGICILDVWFDSCFNSQIATLNALRQVPSVSKMILLSRSSRLLGAIVFIILGITTPTLFAAVRLATTAITFFLSMWILRPKFQFWDRKAAMQVFHQALPFSLSDLLTLIYLQADVTLLSLLTGNKKAVGDYSPALSMVNALFVIPTAFYATLLPVLVRLYRSKSRQFYPFLAGMYGVFAGAGLILWLAVRFGSSFFAILLLGKEYATSGTLLAILSPILFLKCLNIASATLLVAVDKQEQRILPQALSAGANVLLNLWFIPIFLAFGAARVYLVSELILFAGYLWFTIHWLWQNHLREKESTE